MTANERGFAVAAAEIVVRRVGMELESSARGRLSRCVVAEAASRGLDPEAYVDQLDGDADALQSLLDRVTVQETAFFRDTAQFDALAREVLPALGDGITIWSAGCSNGQEAYSLAIVLDELGFTHSRIVATDISTLALDRTRSARYSRAETKGLSAARRERYLRPVDGCFEVIPELRARVEALHHNLSAEPPPFARGACQVVLCRNVLIYFSRAEVKAFLHQLATWLPIDAWLLFGYSESLSLGNEAFTLSRVGSAFLYRRRGGPRSWPDAVPVKPASPRTPARRRVGSASTARAETRQRRLDAETATPVPLEVGGLIADGEAAVQAGDFAAAVAVFRKCTYIDPAQPVAHLHLGLALEASGDPAAARRAYAASRSALDACEPATVEETLEGFHVDELEHLLDAKLAVLQ